MNYSKKTISTIPKVIPTLEEYSSWCAHSKVVPVSCELNTDLETPISLFRKFTTNEYCYLFESVEGGERWARYSFMGRRPLMILKASDGITSIQIGETIETTTADPLLTLENIMQNLKSKTFSHLPRFYSGMVGYFGYDMVKYYEDIKSINPDDINLPDCHLFVPEEVIVYDHLKQKIHIIVNTLVQGDNNTDMDNELSTVYSKAMEKIENMIKEILYTEPAIDTAKDYSSDELDFTSNVEEEEFCDSVRKAKEYIKDGDIFQVVLSQRFKSKFTGNPFEVYRKLRTLNPSPYMYYLKYDDHIIAGASPEMLVRVESEHVETCPIAGTRKRGSTNAEDEELMNDLVNDEKECAEHIMLVDLGRNDIGKVCRFGSVVAKNMMHIEKYSHVMHMVTNVEGKLREDKDALDVLTAVLPAGTVSGAPKVRAMQIIEELENVKRGVYAGAIGYIGFDGNLDTCIAIRTAVFKDDTVYVQAGAGIVADSVPEKEYVETKSKAQALITALKEVEATLL